MTTKKYIQYVLMPVFSLVLLSCSEMDDYKKFQEGGEIVYSGRADSVRLYPGKNRIQLSWLQMADPKVKRAGIYWNNLADSMIVDINKVNSIDSINIVVPDLAHGLYNFIIYTYDDAHNKSVPVAISGRSYGSIYEDALLNRAIESAKWEVNGNTYIDWGTADTTTSIGLEVMYTDNTGGGRTIFVPNSETTTELEAFNSNEPLTYCTMFKPEVLAIDTFYAPVKPIVINEILLENSGDPFVGSDVSGRWGNLPGWTVNDPCKNHDVGGQWVGGFDNIYGGGYISMEFWGTPSITNGKIYQSLTLPAGSYTFVVTVSNIDYTLEATYIAVAAGSTLPDVENIAEAISNQQLTDSYYNDSDVPVSFTLDDYTEVSLGFVGTLKNNDPTSLRIKKVKLYRD